MSENVLRLEDVTMQFGGVVAVDNLTLHVDKGEIVALIGHGLQLHHRRVPAYQRTDLL